MPMRAWVRKAPNPAPSDPSWWKPASGSSARHRGDETQWTDTLRMHEVIRTASIEDRIVGGTESGRRGVPAAVVSGIKDGSISLSSPDTTVALLKLDAVVGLKGNVETIDGKDTLTRVGVTCALCHSTVDDSFAPGIGKRLDGWPNRDLDPGAIIALSPALTPAQKKVYSSWGKGRYDPRYNQDQKTDRSHTSAYGLAGIRSPPRPAMATTSPTGTAMSASPRWGHGSFSEPRTGVKVHGSDDKISASSQPCSYQLSLRRRRHRRGVSTRSRRTWQGVFNGGAGCSGCHSGPNSPMRTRACMRPQKW